MATPTQVKLDIDALKRAWEAKDVEAILAFYADDAEILVIDKNAPPRSPLIAGKQAYAEIVRDVAGRDLTTRIERTVLGDDGAALSFNCRYGDGTRVASNVVLDVRDGRIVRHVEVQAWDE